METIKTTIHEFETPGKEVKLTVYESTARPLQCHIEVNNKDAPIFHHLSPSPSGKLEVFDDILECVAAARDKIMEISDGVDNALKDII